MIKKDNSILNYRFVFLILLILILPKINSCLERINLMGTINFPEEVSKETDFCMGYNGELIEINAKDPFFITKDSDHQQFYILLTQPENINFKPEKDSTNTIQFLKLKKYSLYKFYIMEKIQTYYEDNKKTFLKISWNIKESDLKKRNMRIPENTLIIPISPKDVSLEFENIPFKKSKVIKLPTISIVPQKDDLDLDEIISDSCIRFMNLKPFHSKQEINENQPCSKTKICMIVE